MSASLVGSEMCIRDRPRGGPRTPARPRAAKWRPTGSGSVGRPASRPPTVRAPSATSAGRWPRG
eukprot:11985801-Alexandrium_andersonii.AAC.1